MCKENVQRKTARFVLQNYRKERNTTKMFKDLQLDTSELRSKIQKLKLIHFVVNEKNLFITWNFTCQSMEPNWLQTNPCQRSSLHVVISSNCNYLMEWIAKLCFKMNMTLINFKNSSINILTTHSALFDL